MTSFARKTRIKAARGHVIFLFNGVDTVENIREKFGAFNWMKHYNDDDIMTGQLIEWSDGRFRATSMKKLRAIRNYFINDVTHYELP